MIIDITCTLKVPNAILEDRCVGHATGSCNFTCAAGYEKTVETLDCDEKGNWNHHINTACQSKYYIFLQLELGAVITCILRSDILSGSSYRVTYFITTPTGSSN